MSLPICPLPHELDKSLRDCAAQNSAEAVCRFQEKADHSRARRKPGLHSPFLLIRLVHFHAAIWHNLSSRSIVIRCRKSRCGSGYERLSGRSAKNWASRSSPAFCRENMSICWWKSRRIIPSATSCGASRDAHHIGCRGSSRTCASAPGDGISGRATTSGNFTDDVIHQHLQEHEPIGGSR